MKKRALILANGRPPTKRLLTLLLKDADIFLCADGGSNAAARMGIRPDLIIGDLDSVGKEALRKFAHVQARRIADQNSTDLEKAIGWLARREYGQIVVTGALGGRTDHLLGNLSALAKFSRVASIRIVDDAAEITYLGSEFTFTALPGTIVSLLPLTLCEGITTKGLRWDLKNEVLELGFRESTSNEVKSGTVSVRVRRGDLLLYRVIGEIAQTRRRAVLKRKPSRRRTTSVKRKPARRRKS